MQSVEFRIAKRKADVQVCPKARLFIIIMLRSSWLAAVSQQTFWEKILQNCSPNQSVVFSTEGQLCNKYYVGTVQSASLENATWKTQQDNAQDYFIHKLWNYIKYIYQGSTMYHAQALFLHGRVEDRG